MFSQNCFPEKTGCLLLAKQPVFYYCFDNKSELSPNHFINDARIRLDKFDDFC